MTGVHLHLMVNHLPVAGALFAVLAFLWAMARRGRDNVNFGMICLVLLGGFAAMAYFSGEPAEEAVENIATVSNAYIEQHEDAAKIAFVVAAAAGVIGVLGLAFQKAKAVQTWSAPVGLLSALIASGLMAWTANLGGLVRHTEVRPDAEVALGEPADSGHEDDD